MQVRVCAMQQDLKQLEDRFRDLEGVPAGVWAKGRRGGGRAKGERMDG